MNSQQLFDDGFGLDTKIVVPKQAILQDKPAPIADLTSPDVVANLVTGTTGQVYFVSGQWNGNTNTADWAKWPLGKIKGYFVSKDEQPKVEDAHSDPFFLPLKLPKEPKVVQSADNKFHVLDQSLRWMCTGKFQLQYSAFSQKDSITAVKKFSAFFCLECSKHLSSYAES